jgi:hypothetical protein
MIMIRTLETLHAISRSFLVCASIMIATVGMTGSVIGTEPTSLFVIVGAPGEEQYDEVFQTSAARWKTSGTIAGADVRVFNGEPADGGSDRERLQTALTNAAGSTADLWLVFIGHGTFDNKLAKFNLHGPDVSAGELSEWLKPLKRRIVIIQGASASAPFINQLSAPGRVLITATRSGSEQNYTRFGKFAADALASPQSDIDQDEQNSALEIFLAAARMTEEWYKTEGRLATEHPLIDDNGDGRGTPAAWFNGLQVKTQSKDGAIADGIRANQVHLIRSEFETRLTDEQRQWRDEKELELARLRDRKKTLKEADYLQELEAILIELATFYDGIERQESDKAPSAPTT